MAGFFLQCVENEEEEGSIYIICGLVGCMKKKGERDGFGLGPTRERFVFILFGSFDPRFLFFFFVSCTSPLEKAKDD